MQEKSIAYAAYWRNALADSDLGRGILKKVDVHAYARVSHDESESGYLRLDIVKTFFSDEPEETQFVEVVYRPRLYVVKREHGRSAAQLPEFVTPLITHALLSRDGCLLPKPSTVVPRDILQPLEAGAFSIGALEDLDKHLTEAPMPGISPADVIDGESTRLDIFKANWDAYRAASNRMLDSVCGAFISRPRDFLLVDYGLVLKKSVISGASMRVIRLYDHMRAESPNVPLFEKYASADATPIEPCLASDAGFAARLGHSSDAFALADAQRAALTHVLAARDGEIVALNGPPGTGKTTLLLSVVASLWAQAALDESEPPVVFAASANNQAVTNIIDAFGKDFSDGDALLGGRWLPEISSFGAYLASSTREASASAKYQTNAFFDRIETPEYLDKAKGAFLSRAKLAFSNGDITDIKSALGHLHAALQERAMRLKATEDRWRLFCDAKASVAAELGDDPLNTMCVRRETVDGKETTVQHWKTVKDGWERYRAGESLFYPFFSWLPPVAAKRLRLAREYLKTIVKNDSYAALGDALSVIEKSISERVDAAVSARDDAVHAVERGERLMQAETAASADFGIAARCLGVTGDSASLSLEQCDVAVDTTLRFQIFMLTTHYWEGRWLLEMESQLGRILEKKKSQNPGPATLMPRIRRRMMVTPCAVSTFAMLPEYLRASVRGKEKFDAHYLYNFIDLLIVDEAGQVLPEIAGAAFALARRALVIGDTQQIEPIWSVLRPVDIGNLMSAGLLNGAENNMTYEALARSGKTAASGSVMRIAQHATRYQSEPELDRGLYLYEHRRCYDEIIAFSNALCYHGKLLPRRGSPTVALMGETDHLPPMAYVHVDGACQSVSGGSRRNLLEADTIAAWLAANRAMLEAKYDVPLHLIVGIVTPFGAQVAAIEAACAKVDIKAGREEGRVTVGTVHALQGAERRVILFSPVYSKHEDGGFIDKSASMLNVAVSRAKDSFIVFGDMDVFNSVVASGPRGVLAKYLMARAGNALKFEHRPRADLLTRGTTFAQLRDASEHDAFLLETLLKVKTSFQIVTPWIRLERTKEIGAFDAMCEAVRRGVAVEIYTDPQLNIGDANGKDDVAKKPQLLADAAIFRDAGITVHFVQKVHSKIVIGDDEIYCVGSFNWFSAQRTGQYVRHETSLLYCGADMAHEILAMRKSLLQRRISVAAF